jgi:DNA-binding transcriptional MerR regulator
MGRTQNVDVDNGMLKQLRDNHHVIKRMLFLGRKPEEISKVLGVTTQTVSNVRNSGLMKVALNKMHKEADERVVEVEQRIQNLLPSSLDKLEEVITYGTLDGDKVDVGERLKVLEHSLGRGGFPSNPQVERSGGRGSVTRTTIEKVKMRAMQLAAGSGQLVELEGVTVENT